MKPHESPRRRAQHTQSRRAQFEVLESRTPQAGFEAYFDFGTKSSPLSAGYTRVSEATAFNETAGFGWSSGVIRSADRGVTGNTARDFNYTTDGTFQVNVPNGSYYVDVLLGDAASSAHDLMSVSFEDIERDVASTAGRQVVNRSFLIDVADGNLTLRLRDLGGRDRNAVIEGMRIVSADGPAANPAYVSWPTLYSAPTSYFSEGALNSDGFLTYSVYSGYQRSANTVRVLLPANFDPSRSYRTVYVLPVEAGANRQFGDGLIAVRNAGLQNVHTDAIFIAPTFTDIPWYADHATNSSIWQETYFKSVVVPLVESRLPTLGTPEGRLLFGFSKSGYGAVSMILRSPDFYGRAIAWDSPLAMSDPGSGYGFNGILGSRQNFDTNYKITHLLNTRGSAFLNQPPRIFLLGYSYDFTRNDHRTIDAQMTTLGIPHVYIPGTYRRHHWYGGWVPEVAAALLS